MWMAFIMVVSPFISSITAFSETLSDSLKIEIQDETMKENQPFIVTVTGNKEQLENFQLEKDSSIKEISRQQIDENHFSISLNPSKSGTFTIKGHSGDIRTNEIEINVQSQNITQDSTEQSAEEDKEQNITQKNTEQSSKENESQNDSRKIEPFSEVDDPAVTIQAPNPIGSSQQVVINVTLASSAGLLDEDGIIDVVIPSKIVRNKADITENIVIGSPFSLDSPAVTTDSNGDYVLHVVYDHNKIDQESANGMTFIIKFQAKTLLNSDISMPDSVDFLAKLKKGGNYISEDATSSELVKQNNGNPFLKKMSTRPWDKINAENVFHMGLTDPSLNIFAIIVNYNQKNVKNAKLIDITPEGTELTDPGHYLPTTGDGTPINHICIAKVTSRNEFNIPNGWEYVTNQFSDKISISENGFSIDFGDLTSDDSYVVTYAEKVVGDETPEEFGVRYNKATLYSENNPLIESNVAINLDSSIYKAVALTKEVKQKKLSTTGGELEYTLTLKSNEGDIPAGTVISDPLPETMRYKNTSEKDDAVISDASYNTSGNLVSYKLLKDIAEGTSQTIKFIVSYENSDAKPGDIITNKASINYAGSNIFSNAATTTLDGSAYLYKIDGTTRNPLAGAEFKIINDQGEAVAENLVSNEEGFINSGLLAPGDYQFIETKAPTNYQLDTTPIDFTVVSGQEMPIKLTATNQLVPGSVILTKTDAQSGETLQGAVFALQDQTGKVLQSGLTTDASGKIAIDDLAPGDYQLVETQAPTGYELDETPVTFTIEKGQTEAVQVSMTNQLVPGSVILTKTDAQSGETLQGAVFALQDQTGKVLQSGLTTDASGKIAIDDLAPGDYQLVETQAPTGYELDETPVTFTIEKGQTEAVQVSMTNEMVPGSVILTKVDAQSGETLQGAVFALQDQTGKVLQSGLTTDASGKIAIDDLAPGDYQLVETQAPTGYELDETPVTFTIEKGQTEAVQVSMTNQLVPGSVILTKTDAQSGETLQGAVFALQDQTGKVLQSGLTTDASGKIAIDDLAPGDYQLVETQAPTGYELDETPVTFTIEKGQTEAVQVSMTNQLVPGSVILTKTDAQSGETLQGAVFALQDQTGKVLQSGLTTDASGKIAIDDLAPGDYQLVETQAPTGYELDETPVTFTIEKGQTEAVQVSMTNQLVPGSVILTKVDAQSGETLQGAVFALQDQTGKVLQSGLTTDASGKIAIDDLAPGDYQLVETQAPTGYELDETPVTFTIEKGQTEAVQVSMTNQLVPGSVILTKTDAQSGETLQGAVFALQDQTGKVLQSGLTTDASGKIAIDDLAPGDYQLVETQAPTGYELDETPVTFTIEKGQTEAVQVSMTNQLVPGSVILTKTDAQSGETLQGAVFALQDQTGKVLQSGLTTDASGKIAIDDLAPGDYQLVETQAPTGYELDETPVTFTIEKGQTEAVQVSMTNQLVPGSVILTKVDAQSGETLQGAVFALQDQTGKVLQSGLTTDASGKIAIDDLAPGDYQLVETQAPTGYELDETPVTFTIEKGQTEAVQVSMTNQLVPGSVILTKVDAQSGETLQGAVFALQDQTGKVLQSGLTTDASGKIAIDDLAPRDYQLVETQAPTGYELDETPVTFTIEKGQTEAVQVSMTNEMVPGSVILTKVDAQSGETLQGAVFALQDQTGKVLQSGLTTDASGKIAIDDLAPGDYQLVETQAPTGYELDETPVTFTIEKGQTEAVQVSMTNEMVPGSVILTKVDAQSGETLQGAVFALQDQTGKVLQSGLTTDASGKIAIDDLTPRDYQLVETKAPDGYKLDKTPVKFTIKEGDYTRIEVEKTNKLLPSTEKPGNKDGQLPKTGEQNSFVLYVIGFGLLIFVGLLFVARRGKTK
jgi:LPXTG-motif cell wall-anchored protein